jgi:alkylhydroperoxidase family enzyme
MDSNAEKSNPPAPRITPLDPPYAPELQSELDKLMRGAPPLAIFRTVARNPRVLARMLAGGLLDRGSITLRQRELMILRTTALCGAEYEWGVHVAGFGAKAQWTEAQLASTVHGAAADACWSKDEQAVIRLADTLHRTSHVDDAAWAELKTHFADDQLIELLMLAGLYHAVSYVLNGARVALEPGAPRLPEP